MLKLPFLWGCLLLVSGALAQPQKEGAYIVWEADSHDFGEITEGAKIEHVYRFTNTGAQPLIITNIEVTCGCTTPKGWPRDPIGPGGKGEFTVAFNSAGKVGRVTKVVRVVSNATNAKNQVTFTATIVEKKVDQ
ncbi:MAG: DUF1573 domain-containing protein [Cyclobacteriaceae bacterium]|jgi:hypothetical protein|nr:DUF1573 domain-containing protein [Cyclobacteriaceae bacterium]